MGRLVCTVDPTTLKRAWGVGYQCLTVQQTVDPWRRSITHVAAGVWDISESDGRQWRVGAAARNKARREFWRRPVDQSSDTYELDLAVSTLVSTQWFSSFSVSTGFRRVRSARCRRTSAGRGSPARQLATPAPFRLSLVGQFGDEGMEQAAPILLPAIDCAALLLSFLSALQ